MKVLVWGAGGHGKVVADLVRVLGHELTGFVDADAAKLDRVAEPGGGLVVATEAQLRGALSAGEALPGGATAIIPAFGDNSLRLQAVKLLGTRATPALVHPSAVTSASASIAAGTVVFPLAVINASAGIGHGVIVNSGVILEHDVQLANGVHVSPGAVLAGAVRVGETAWIGAGAVVLPGIHVGARAVVGAGAVVTRDVPEGLTVVGSPARPLQPRPR